MLCGASLGPCIERQPQCICVLVISEEVVQDFDDSIKVNQEGVLAISG